MISAHADYVVLLQKLNAACEVARPVAEITGTQQSVCTGVQQCIDRCLKTRMFSVDVADQANTI